MSTIAFSDEYFTVSPTWTYGAFQEWRSKNPRAPIAEHSAKRKELEAARKEQVKKLTDAGYPREKRFPKKQEKLAHAYAAKIEKDLDVKMDVTLGFDMAF